MPCIVAGERWVRHDGAPEAGGGYKKVIERIPVDAYRRFRFRGPCRDAEPQVSEPQLLVSGLLPEDSQSVGSLQPLWGIPDGWLDTTPRSGGDGLVRILDAQHNELWTSSFEWRAEPGGYGFFVLPAPDPPEAAAVELYRSGSLQDVITRTVHAPQVTLASPVSGMPVTETLRIEWTATDADGDQLLAEVFYSSDGRAGWVPLGSGGPEGVLVVSSSALPSSTAGIVRLYVTDGFNTTVSEVTDLELLPDRAPTVTIYSPMEGQSFLLGENIVFLAHAYDLEDGWLGPEAVSWHSSIDGFLGTGELNVANLTPGTHVVTAVVSGHGGPKSAAATISVSLP